MGAVIADAAARRVGVDRGDPRLELHDPLELVVATDRIAIQCGAGAHHVQPAFGDFQGGEGVGAVQEELAAVEFGLFDQPGGLVLELGQALQHVLAFLYREVGHDPRHLQGVHAGHCHSIPLPLRRAHLQAIAAHTRRVQGQVHGELAATALGQGVKLSGDFQVADQLLDAIGQGIFHLADAGAAQAHQATLEALRPGDAGLFIAGDTDAVDAHFDGGRNQQGNTGAVGIGLHHCADLALASQALLELGNIAFEGSLVDFQPGVAFGAARVTWRVIGAGLEQRSGMQGVGGAGQCQSQCQGTQVERFHI
ncbi:hypothetical protein D3C84_527300 [compost metagenome]